MNRRDFVAGAAGMALSAFPAGLAGMEREKGKGGLERRPLGRTGEKLSIIGFGGVVVMNATAEEAGARVRHAIDAGVNYFDVAPSYGNAEDMLGPALEPFGRACSSPARRRGARRRRPPSELESSLQKMRTDHFDLYQHHAVTKKADARRSSARRRHGGVLEARRRRARSASSASRRIRSRRRCCSWTATTSTRSSSP